MQALGQTRRAALALAALAFLAGCATPPTPTAAPAERPPLFLTILHTNDHHGRFWPNADGEYGMAARKTVVDRIRAEVTAAGGHSLLLDGGDINTGVPESDLQDAEPDFKGMALIGYDASAVGNHEFDKPPAVLAKQRQWINFPLLAANIYKDGQRMFPPYALFERGGYKIAVMGLTTDDTQKFSLPANIVGIEFRKPIAEAAALLPSLRAQADVVIATTHMGHYSTDAARGVNAPGDVQMARALPPGDTPIMPARGLDLIVGGHSQNPVCMLMENVRNTAYVPGEPCAPDRQNGTWIVQAHEWGKYVGRADFELRGGEFKLLRYELIPINLKRRLADGTRVHSATPIAEDVGLRSFLQPFQDKGQVGLNSPVGQTVGLFDGDRQRVRQQPNALGRLAAQAMADKIGADLAVMNSGGLRDSLPEGLVTYRDVLKVQPFGNQLAVVRMSGTELLAWLQAVARMTPGAGAFPQTWGLQMVVESGVLVQAQVQDRPIEPLREYRLGISNFTASGGDGYPALDRHPGYINTGFVDAEVLREYIARRSPIKVTDFAPGNEVQRR